MYRFYESSEIHVSDFRIHFFSIRRMNQMKWRVSVWQGRTWSAWPTWISASTWSRSPTPDPTPYTLHPTTYTLLNKQWTISRTPYTLHPAPYTRQPTPYTLDNRFYTLHPTPYTLNPTPYTLYPEPLTLHPTPYTLNPTPYTLHPTPCTLHSLCTRVQSPCRASQASLLGGSPDSDFFGGLILFNLVDDRWNF